jgi:hypothetical protein
MPSESSTIAWVTKPNEIDQQKESGEAVFGENTVKKKAIKMSVIVRISTAPSAVA